MLTLNAVEDFLALSSASASALKSMQPFLDRKVAFVMKITSTVLCSETDTLAVVTGATSYIPCSGTSLAEVTLSTSINRSSHFAGLHTLVCNGNDVSCVEFLDAMGYFVQRVCLVGHTQWCGVRSYVHTTEERCKPRRHCRSPIRGNTRYYSLLSLWVAV